MLRDDIHIRNHESHSDSRSERARSHELRDEYDAAAFGLVHLPEVVEADDVWMCQSLHQPSLLPESVPLLLTQTVTAQLET